MFQAYCAACHGADAKGNGPAASALRKTPSDLTQLTKNAGGKFPELRVYDVIRGDTALPAHGSSNMPVWGRVFRSMSGSDMMTHHRLATLTRYIESLQR
jgi:mono/diheme cytochrome c family protein